MRSIPHAGGIQGETRPERSLSMPSKRWILAVPGLLAATAFAHNVVGGWAVVSVQDVPDYAVAGQPLTLTYSVRQHGEELMYGLKGSVSARSSSGASVSVPAKATSQHGFYTAAVMLPNAGDWTLVIESGFGKSRGKLLPIRAVESGSRPLPSFTPAERGRRLFVAKGCVTCHTHSDNKSEIGSSAAPDLTDKTFAPAYLADFLTNPKIKPPANKSGWQMPNLALKQAEVAALVAFINSDRKVALR
jgi:mono/diheme cytochrome c family protein